VTVPADGADRSSAGPRAGGARREGSRASPRNMTKKSGGAAGSVPPGGHDQRAGRRTPDLTSKHGDLVAQCQQLDLVGALGTQEDQGKSKNMAKSEVHESPQASAHSVPPHPVDGSPSDLVQKVPIQRRKIGYSDTKGPP